MTPTRPARGMDAAPEAVLEPVMKTAVSSPSRSVVVKARKKMPDLPAWLFTCVCARTSLVADEWPDMLLAETNCSLCMRKASDLPVLLDEGCASSCLWAELDKVAASVHGKSPIGQAHACLGDGAQRAESLLYRQVLLPMAS